MRLTLSGRGKQTKQKPPKVMAASANPAATDVMGHEGIQWLSNTVLREKVASKGKNEGAVVRVTAHGRAPVGAGLGAV